MSHIASPRCVPRSTPDGGRTSYGEDSEGRWQDLRLAPKGAGDWGREDRGWRPRDTGRVAAFIAVLAALVCAAPSVDAHGLQPSIVEIREESVPGHYAVAWSIAVEPNAEGEEERVELPPRCRAVVPSIASEAESRSVRRWVVDCGSHGLAGERVGVSFPSDVRHAVILRVAPRGAPVWSAVLSPAEPAVTMPGPTQSPSASETARACFVLGVRHLATGFDHVVALLALMLLVRAGRSLVLVIAALSLGQCATLAMASLGLVRVPAAPAAAMIAVSGFFVAREVVCAERRDGDMAVPARSRPWLLAAAVGLVQGPGFARAFSEADVLHVHRALALGAFNAGIELGQLAFVGLCVAVWRVARGFHAVNRARGRVALAYAIGGLASCWCIERIAGFWAA